METDFHNSSCACAYCEGDREESLVSRQALTAACIYIMVGVFLGWGLARLIG